MKLFIDTGKKTKAIMGYIGDDKNNIVELFPRKHIMQMKKETVDYLLNANGGSTLNGIRYLIANLYNYKVYSKLNLFGLIRDADTQHQELIMDIIGISQSKYHEACFDMIDDLAPKIIKKFKFEKLNNE